VYVFIYNPPEILHQHLPAAAAQAPRAGARSATGAEVAAPKRGLGEKVVPHGMAM